MSDANEKELTVFGFAKGMRAGFVTFIMSMEAIAIIYLFIAFRQSETDKQQLQAKLYEKMIDYIRPTRDKLEEAAKKVDTAVVKVNNSVELTDSLNNSLIDNQIPK